MNYQEKIQYTNSFAAYTWTDKKSTATGISGSTPLKNEMAYTNKETVESQVKSNNVSVYDVAAYILKQMKESSTMKLHKLLYYCQAWSLVWDEKSLFPEHIEAWANGPVIRDFFNFHKGRYSISYNDMTVGNENKLSKEQKETIDNVLLYYGDKPAQWLIDLTHSEIPWKNARKGYAPLERGNALITNDSMANYYSSLQ